MNSPEECPHYPRPNNLHEADLVLQQYVTAVKHGHPQRAVPYLIFDVHHFDEGVEEGGDNGERGGDEGVPDPRRPF